MGVGIKGESVLGTLGEANELAKHNGEALSVKPELKDWLEVIDSLREDRFPKTYLAVLAVLLTARAMHEPDVLDVRDIKQGTSILGFSASSVAGRVAAFAKEQHIDLRATSTAPMNNQPFTFKDRIHADMGVQAKFEGEWKYFYDAVLRVNEVESATAREVLGLLFHTCRVVDAPADCVRIREGGGKSILDAVSRSVASFVLDTSDNGKVGQAFVAAILDLLYGPDHVWLGKTQDPDATAPGDVQVGSAEDGVWLWTEAKQKVITTGDITGFMRKVSEAGGGRVIYFALVNSGYSGNIKLEKIRPAAEQLGLGIKVVESPQEALDWVLPLAPGRYDMVASSLLEGMLTRLVQSSCTNDTLSSFRHLIDDFAEASPAQSGS